MKLIKYANRKLYNPATSTYATLKEVRSHILTGGTIKVVDHKTKNDITSQVLANAVVQAALGRTWTVEETVRFLSK